MSPDGRRRRILVLNQYYWPGVEATAHLLTELCEALAEDYEVEVVTGVLHGHEDAPREDEHNGVRIVRVSSTSYERSELARRAANYFSYLGAAFAHALRSPAPDLVLCMTDPPIVGDVGVALGRRFGVPVLVISQDVFPEIATELDRLRNPAVVGVLGGLVGAYLRRADRIVAIGETMRERLQAKGAPPERLRVIPNWVDTRAITPQPRDNEWAGNHDLVTPFVAMHSGNVGPRPGSRQPRPRRDVSPRPGRPADRDRRLRRAARGDGHARRHARGRRHGALPSVPEARAPSALALERGRPRRRSREGARRIRRPESPVRDPLRRHGP